MLSGDMPLLAMFEVKALQPGHVVWWTNVCVCDAGL